MASSTSGAGEHTPGPWEVREVSSDLGPTLAVVESGKLAGDAICFVTALAGEGEDDRANARLIAAAPALYEALEALEREASEFAKAIPPYANSEPLAAARAALRLAQGGENADPS